jgi:hypothetical protein
MIWLKVDDGTRLSLAPNTDKGRCPAHGHGLCCKFAAARLRG